MRRSTEEILGWIRKERAYQDMIGRRAMKIGAEIDYVQGLLDEAKVAWAANKDTTRQRVTMRCFRRIAANLVRSMEKYGVSNDQEMQMVPEPEEREDG